MQFLMITSVLASVAIALAMPGGSGGGSYACPAGLYSNAQCCATNVLGVAALDCAGRKFSLRL